VRRALLAITPLLLFAACSADDTADPAPPSPSTTTPSTTAPSTTAPTTSTTIAATDPLIAPRSLDELLALGRPIVLAHSGGEDAFPSETMFSFTESARAGVDMLDVNLQLTLDGMLVTFHDDTLERTTNAAGSISAITTADLQLLDAAYWFSPSCGTCGDQPEADYVHRGVRTGATPPPAGYTPEDFRVPTLQEVVVSFPGAPLNVEIKGDGEQGIVTAIALSTFITDNPDVADRIVVSSFNDEALARFMALQPDIEVSPGLGAVTEWVLNRVPLPDGMRILQIPPEYEGITVIDPTLVADSTAAGYPIWVWPNNRDLEDLESYLDFLELGIAGLNINQPAMAVEAVQQFLSGS
jgi:glycerophosphoryl diester phosphodiesterase